MIALTRILTSTVASPARKVARRMFSKLLYASFSPELRVQLDLIERVRKERSLLLRVDEAYYLVNAVRSAHKIPGDFAEVGVYQGGSAKLICENRPENRTLHLFDTFQGLPKPTEHDTRFVEGEYTCSLESVRTYLRAYPDVRFYKGLFPSTAGPVSDRKFAFVNLDVDLYEGSLGCLEFFYPRMSPGGVLVSHDYGSQTGVRKAFDEFFADKPEPLIRLIGSQCMMIRLGDPHSANGAPQTRHILAESF